MRKKKPRSPNDTVPKSKDKQGSASSIPTKDIKILWARAAGLCSFPGCQIPLTMDEKKQDHVTLGEMCHIVGEKSAAARGKSPLPMKERNCYANLVLFCPNHHKEVDRLEKKYTVEVLHKMKADHEQWVSETLAGGDIDPDDQVCADVIDNVTTLLQLDHWTWFIDNAVRDLVHLDFVEATTHLGRIRLATIWPTQKHKRLRKAIQDMIDSFIEFMGHFESNADLREHSGFLGADRSYAKYYNPHYREYQEWENWWSNRNLWLSAGGQNRPVVGG